MTYEEHMKDHPVPEDVKPVAPEPKAVKKPAKKK